MRSATADQLQAPAKVSSGRGAWLPASLAGLALFALALACVPWMPAQAETTVRLVFAPSFIPTFPQKRIMNGRYGPEMRELRAQILERNGRGEDLPCSTQILKEVDWLIDYTSRADVVERRLADLRRSLDMADQSFAAEQTEADGSWGACFEPWFLRVHNSVDPIKELRHRGERPTYRLGFLDPVNTPDKLVRVMEELLISDMAKDGVNHRKELNLLVTGLAQLLFLPDLAEMLPPEFPREDVAAALRDFMDNTWQDPETGYWGAWYRINGEVRKTNDLSITFHVISYRQDDPPRMKQLADTTFNLRYLNYPYGWRDDGRQNNHHAYDVVRLLRRSWPHMSEDQRIRTSAEMTLMLARSIRLSIDHNGAFVVTPYDSVAEAYYFGVSFLDEIGLFNPKKLFWAPIEIGNVQVIRQGLEKELVTLDSDDPMAAAALRKLRAPE